MIIPWPKNPLIYEINTWVWLQELGGGVAPLSLAAVPEKEWDAIAALGFNAVWLMGVWERSPAGIAVSMENQELLEDFRRALPDFSASDNVGSPYCVRRYAVDPHLGGPEGLAVARGELARRGMRLILDFIPNHVAPDHPWVIEYPDYFIQGSIEEAVREPASFLSAGGNVFACGRDPFFPPWPDVLQLNAFSTGLRSAAADTVKSIAEQCDGVRCDMAMLVMNDIFRRTWGERAGDRPAREYWPELIGAVRRSHPGFLFMAEAYWDLEWELQQQGFDFCYDKKLYDRLEHAPVEALRLHLCADMTYQERLVRFIENHDEPRAAALFPPGKARAAALLAVTLPGAALLHEGQLEGRTVRLPVFLGRRPDEPPDRELAAYYEKLMKHAARELFRNGEWRLCERSGWSDNHSYFNIVAWNWRRAGETSLVILNLSDTSSQAFVWMPWDQAPRRNWRLDDILSGESYERNGDEMRDLGLYVDLKPWQCHLFQVRAV